MEFENTKKKELISFLTLAFLISWGLWLPPFLKSQFMPDLPDWVRFLSFLAPFGPGAAAFIILLSGEGKGAAKSLFLSGWRKPKGTRWLFPVLLIGPATAFVTIIILRALSITPDWKSALPLPLLIPVGIVLFISNGLGEEYGWRGFALPRLEMSLSPLTAALIIGVIWSLWHIPLFFITGTTQQIIPFHEYALQTIVFSFLYSWIAHKTSYSVFAAALFHTVSNLSAAVLPFWTVSAGRWIQFSILLIITIFFLRNLIDNSRR